jgi:hypothetical protein
MAYTRVQAGDDVTPEQINDVYDSMEKLEAMTAEVVETLPAGSSASAEVVTDGSGNKKLELKIPQGATGATGQDGTNGKSVEWQGEWDTNVNYVNTAVKADLVRKDGNVYICKQNNQGAPPPNAVYWALFVQKGEDGLGAGNIKGTNVTALEVGKTYAIQATTIPGAEGTLEGILVEVASVEDLDRKLEKNFDGFYSEKTVLNDNDLFVIQDSESGATPKVNKRVKISRFKAIKVDNAGSADSATNADNATDAINVSGTGKLGTAGGTSPTNNRQPDSIFETGLNRVKEATKARDYDTSTGTIKTKFADIDERLDNLGFRSGTVSLAGGTASVNYVYRQGNYVYGKVQTNNTSVVLDYGGSGSTIFTIPSNFRPKTAMTSRVEFHVSTTGGLGYTSAKVTINTNGTVVCSDFRASITRVRNYEINFGYEANPIT